MKNPTQLTDTVILESPIAGLGITILEQDAQDGEECGHRYGDDDLSSADFS